MGSWNKDLGLTTPILTKVSSLGLVILLCTDFVGKLALVVLFRLGPTPNTSLVLDTEAVGAKGLFDGVVDCRGDIRLLATEGGGKTVEWAMGVGEADDVVVVVVVAVEIVEDLGDVLEGVDTGIGAGFDCIWKLANGKKDRFILLIIRIGGTTVRESELALKDK